MNATRKESKEIGNSNAGTGRGGRRPGAGRKKGSATKRTRAIADRAAREGITPLEVMLKTMRALVAKAERLTKTKAKPEKGTASPLELMVEAAAVAKDAAPYMHPRLSAVEHSGPNKGPIQSVSMTPGEFEQAARDVLSKV